MKKYYFTDFSFSEQKLIIALRAEGKFVYHIRDCSDEDLYTIERKALVNRIGFLITNEEILGEGIDDFLTGREFMDMVIAEGWKEDPDLRKTMKMKEAITTKISSPISFA